MAPFVGAFIRLGTEQLRVEFTFTALVDVLKPPIESNSAASRKLFIIYTSTRASRNWIRKQRTLVEIIKIDEVRRCLVSGDESEMIYLIARVFEKISIAAVVVCLISTHVKRRTSSCRFIARSTLRSKRKTNCAIVFRPSLLGYTRFQSSGQVCGAMQAPRLLSDIFPTDFPLPPSKKNSNLSFYCASNVVHNKNVCSTSRIQNVNTFSCFSQIKTSAFDILIRKILVIRFPLLWGRTKNQEKLLESIRNGSGGVHFN